MVGVFVGLKLRLIAGSLRGDAGRVLGFVLGAVAALAASVAGFLGFVLLGRAAALAPVSVDVVVLAFTLTTVGWAAVPVLAFRSDGALDPAHLAPLPLRPRAAAWGLFVAAGVGLPPLATLVALAGGVAGFATGPLPALFGATAVLLTTAMCLLAGRALPLALAGLLRGWRAMDLAIGATALLAGVAAPLPWALARRSPEDLEAGISAAAGVARWTPPGMAALAMTGAGEGGYALAGLRLGVAAAAVALLALWWVRLLERALVSYREAEGPARARDRRTGRFGPWPLPGRAAATLARELRYTWREPRRRAGAATLLLTLACLLAISPLLAAGTEGEPSGTGPSLVVVACCAMALSCLGNHFGAQGPALWGTVAAVTAPRELRAELLGGALAAAVVCVPMLAGFVAGLALWGGTTVSAVSALPVFVSLLGLGLGVFGVALGVGGVMSVLLPYPPPDRGHSPFAAPGSGQGLLTSIAFTVAVAAVNVLAAPLYMMRTALAGGGGWPLLVGDVAYGALACWGLLAVAASLGYRRLPEILSRASRAAV